MVARNILHALAFMAPVVAVEFLRAISRVTLTHWQDERWKSQRERATEGQEGHRNIDKTGKNAFGGQSAAINDIRTLFFFLITFPPTHYTYTYTGMHTLTHN